MKVATSKIRFECKLGGTPTRPQLRIRGALDEANVYQIRDALRGLIEDGQNFIVLDLSGISAIDSSGLSLIAKSVRECRRRGGALAIVRPVAANACEAFEAYALSEFLDIHADGELASRVVDKQIEVNRSHSGVHEKTGGETADAILTEISRAVSVLAHRMENLERQFKRLDMGAS